MTRNHNRFQIFQKIVNAHDRNLVLNTFVPKKSSEMRPVFPLASRERKGFNLLKFKSVRQL
jgi:hypothetical protein